MKQYIVDAFTDTVFRGNPAAVCILDAWIPDATMMKIAMENRFSETAFAVQEGAMYHLRWFTPGGEIDLCGHATLATAYILFHFYEKDAQEICFKTLSGPLMVRREVNLICMDFPAYSLMPVPVTDAMAGAIGVRPERAYIGRDLICGLSDEAAVRNAKINQQKALDLNGLLLHITACGKDYDCVSRSFAPKLGVPEDPVCGSGHCHMVPLWSAILGKNEIKAFQASERTGVLYTKMKGSRVELAGKAALYSIGELVFPMEVR